MRISDWSASVCSPDLAGEGEGDTIVVSGYRYLSENTSGTTGLPVPIEKVPQSISLVSEDFLDATDARSLGDVAQYTPGDLFDGHQGGTSAIATLRGTDAGNEDAGLDGGRPVDATRVE